MKTSLYILGYLLRHGPLHGYKLKALIDESAHELTNIKLPTLYYHLEQLSRKGHVISETEQHGKRPERMVYTITEEGKKSFIKMLEKALAKNYEAEFLLDAVFFFGDAIPLDQLILRLENKKSFLESAFNELQEQKEGMLDRFTEGTDVMARAIFRHHESHYEAEINWLKETLQELKAITGGKAEKKTKKTGKKPAEKKSAE